jgi:recombination protein RecT
MVKRDDKGQIQRSSENGGGVSLSAFVSNDLGPQIALALPKHLNPDRMTRIVLTALRTTPALLECDRFSFAAAIIQAAQLGLEVNTPLGHAYLIPRKKAVTLQLGYQGMIDLARRSGQVSSIYAFTVHEGDEFAYELGLDPKLRHVPGEGVQSEATMRFVYAVAKLRGPEDDRQFVVLSKHAVDERKARGQGGPAWKTDYLAMARKTAVRALFTWLPKSPEMAQAVRLDDGEAMQKSTASLVDERVTEALAAMALPPPSEIEDGIIETPTYDPSTGEVHPDDEPSDEDLGR